MSSSSSGQWMPSPEPIRRQLDRCARVPWSNRGNHAIGTVMVRPSDNSTAKLSLPTVTRRAISSWFPEVLMPCSQYQFLVFADELFYLANLHRSKSVIVRQLDRTQPKLGFGLFPLHMNMRTLDPIRRIEEQPVGSIPQNRRQRFQFTGWTECVLNLGPRGLPSRQQVQHLFDVLWLNIKMRRGAHPARALGSNDGAVP